MALKKWVFGTKLSQQITEQNANLTEIENGLTVTDITSTIATSQVEGFTITKALKQGKRVDVIFTFKPVSGWNSGIATLSLKPATNTPITIHKNSASDINLNISGLLNTAGAVTLLTSVPFSNAVIGQISYITL